jgi:hypothetical protein
MKRAASIVVPTVTALVAIVWLIRRTPVVPPAPPPLRVSAAQDAAPAAPAPTGSPASSKLAELRAMSPTFLGSTLLIAIRDAGFVCDEVVDVDQSEPDSPVWRAHCRDLRAYLVRVASSGALAVEPTVAIWDGNFPRPLPERPPEDTNDPFDLRR